MDGILQLLFGISPIIITYSVASIYCYVEDKQQAKQNLK